MDIYTYPIRSSEFLECLRCIAEGIRSPQNSEGFRYDLVDVVRQALANYSNVVQEEFAAAYMTKDRQSFDDKVSEFLTLIDDMDELLATRTDFLLGRWLGSARKMGISKQEKISTK